MGPVIHCSVGDISLFPRTTFIPRKDIQLTKYNVSGRYTRLSSYSQRLLLPQSSLRLFQFYRSGCGSEHGSRFQILAAVGTDVTVEEQNPAISGEDADETLGSPPNSVETSETAPADPAATTTARSQRSRPMRKSEMPPVKDEELISGASFTGKVRSIQPFGAFVDIGAYTEGLVHVSRMSDGYVKDVSAVVSVGQEVKVRIVDANKESGRISLTMRDSDDPKTQQRKEAPTSGSSDKPRPVGKNVARPNQRRDPVQKRSKFVKGQVLDGTVKNITRSGAFVSLPDGEEGFLPVSEESEGFGAILGNTSLQIGQEVNVRVLRFSRGKVTLTMKKEEDAAGLNVQLNQGVVHAATNPFELAFRKNKDISGFLEERERVQKASENLSIPKTSEQIGEKVSDAIATSVVLEVDASTANSNENQVNISSASGVVLEEEEITSKGLHEEISAAVSTELVSNEEEPVSSSPQNANIVLESLAEDEDSSRTFTESSSSLGLDEVSIPNDEKDSSAAIETVEEQFGSSEAVISEDESSANGSSTSLGTDEASTTYGDKEAGEDIKAVEENVEVLISESSVSNQVSVTDEVNESNVITITEVETSSENLSTETIGPPAESIEVTDSVKVEESNFDTRSSDKIDEQILSPKGEVPKEVASSQSDGILVNDEVVTEPPLLLENEMPSSDSKDVKVKAPEESNAQTALHEQGGAIKATISPALVKQLREESGAGMMDCKKALAETAGDIVKAQEFLRKKGLASADKKASRATAEGRVGSYIHDNRIGVLIEVNCETDFVSRGEIFKQLVDDLAMQVAACPQVRYLATEDVPEEIVNKEREIEMQKEDLLSKPEQMRSKIVDGRIRKRLEEFALLEQPYIKNDKMVVKDLVKQTIATIGENIKVKRFARYNLGEGLEKKSQDFAAEVAAQTAAKPSPAVAAPKDQSAETKETVERPPTIAVSAALVKQLREETGAGMMDCKKALTETGGDLEKAQEYLRKKGLSSADKKSSRLAAEGRISSYIHDSRIGVLIEVNSETDFVARNEKFKELVDDLAMQVVACPQVEFVSVEDIPESVVSKEKELEMQREDLKSKPENIREKIVEGRISKRLGELALLEQPFIKDDSVMVKDLVKQTVAALGENIRVRRFVRYTLGESKD